MATKQDFYGPNLGYVLELYERYQNDPESLDTQTREFFRNWTPPIFSDGQSNGSSNGHAAPATPSVDINKVVGAVSFAQAIRQFGHLAAQLDPLGSPPPDDPELYPDAHGITYADLQNLPAGLILDGPIAETSANALEAIETLRSVYCSSIGYDNEHIQEPAERAWLREAAESRRFRYEWNRESSLQLLERLTQVETMELFLQRTFPSKYRFSVEGLDMMVPMLDEMVIFAKDTDAEMMAMGMAHRGRLNTLAHILNQGYANIFAEFTDTQERAEEVEAVGYTVDDVKYHKGAVYNVRDSKLVITMSPNPSHLEAVNPVVVGMARAAATRSDRGGAPEFDPHKTTQVLIHGDAAFPGQGIVAETFNLSRLPGYAVGGTIHIIANNQLGFTTLPRDGRSTLYASDLAKGFRVPIIHVNADDPAACIEVARMAIAFSTRFEKDVLIDLIGYRRYGHNELDQPSFTQPKLYEVVRKHPTARALWAEQLEKMGLLDASVADTKVATWNAHFQDIYDNMDERQEGIADLNTAEPEQGLASKIETQVDADQLLAINDGLAATLDGHTFFNSRFEKGLRARRAALAEPDVANLDWATAEELAFATILSEGVPVRMTGQDCERGTFSHRHAVLHDAETGAQLTPLQRFPQARASFEIHNSPLSEEAVVGFEYGYNIQAGNTLTIWEAQYGDFVNGAQNIIDEFVLSAREKWGDTPSLVMLLPHGHEGAGPDHSSGRLERFLSLAAKTNMRVVNPTTASQYFHLLRRQALLLETDPLPLIVMSPKSLLRDPRIAASMNDLTGGQWQAVIDDTSVKPKEVKRLVFCSGKFYYDLACADYREQYSDVALVRVEQLYPFPAEQLQAVLKRYPKVTQIVWAQEEPKNMGAWDYINYRLKKLVGMDTPVNYVGRRRSSSPAEGSKTAWKVNQNRITGYAFHWNFETDTAQPRHE